MPNSDPSRPFHSDDSLTVASARQATSSYRSGVGFTPGSPRPAVHCLHTHPDLAVDRVVRDLPALGRPGGADRPTRCILGPRQEGHLRTLAGTGVQERFEIPGSRRRSRRIRRSERAS